MIRFEVTDYGYSIQAQVQYIGADLFIQLTRWESSTYWDGDNLL